MSAKFDEFGGDYGDYGFGGYLDGGGSDFAADFGDYLLGGWFDSYYPGGDSLNSFNIPSETCADRFSPGCLYPLDYDPLSFFGFGPGPAYEPEATTLPPGSPGGDWWKDLITPWQFDPFTFEPTGYDPFVIAPIPASPNLPGYCPAGTYHPINDPFACVPFPNSQPATGTRTQPRSSTPPTRTPAPTQQPQCPSGQTFNAQLRRCVPVCPQGQAFSPQAGRCVTVPQCPAGSNFNVQTGRCEKSTQPFVDAVKSVPWWLWLVGAAVVVKATESDSSGWRRK